MAGGTWDFQNKVQPGIYINFKSSPSTLATAGERGIVAIACELDWGPIGEIITITSPQELYTKLGYDVNDSKMRFAQQIFRGSNRGTGASRILVYRLDATGAAKAKITADGLTATARYEGSRGNDISVIIVPDPDSAYTVDSGDGQVTKYAVFSVETVVDGSYVHTQTVGSYASKDVYTAATVGDLVSNDWVVFSGSGELAANAGISLTGGGSGTVAPTAYANFLSKLEPYTFTVLAYDGSDAVTKVSFATFVQRLGYDNGRYSQMVTSDYHGADEIMVISVKNGFELNDGTILSPEQAVWWVAGVQASASVFQSMTYAAHPDAVSVSPRLSTQEMDAAISEGSIAFIEEFNETKILSDVNTFTSFSPERGKVFAKNRTVRVLFSVANDIYRTFAQYYVGTVDNTQTGRNLFKAEIISYMLDLQGNGAIQNFEADDVEVTAGNEVDAIVVNIAVQVVGAVEKVYMTVTVTSEQNA